MKGKYLQEMEDSPGGNTANAQQNYTVICKHR